MSSGAVVEAAFHDAHPAALRQVAYEVLRGADLLNSPGGMGNRPAVAGQGRLLFRPGPISSEPLRPSGLPVRLFIGPSSELPLVLEAPEDEPVTENPASGLSSLAAVVGLAVVEDVPDAGAGVPVS